MYIVLALIISPITYRISLTAIATAKTIVGGREYIDDHGISLSPVTLFTRLSEQPDVDEVHIDSNDFVTVVPDNIGILSSLNALIIVHNPIHQLPRTVGNLTALEYLTVQNTRLTSLPDTLVNNQQLIDLSLQGNRLTRLPDIFNSLQQLQTLNLAHNNLKSLPPSVGNLSQLALLDLTGNKLTSVPTNLPPNLELLFLGGNPIPIDKLVEAQLKHALTDLIIFY